MTDIQPQNTFSSLASVENLSHPPRPPRIRFSGTVLTAERGGLRVPAEARQHCALFSNGMWLVREESAELALVKEVAALAERKGYKIVDPRFVAPDVLVQAANYARKVNNRLPKWFYGAMAALAIVSVFGFAGRLIWFLDWVGYFRLHYALLGLPLIIMAFRTKKWALSAACAALVALNLGTIAFSITGDLFQPPPSPPAGAPQITVALASAPSGAGGQTEARRWLELEHPDVMVILQANRLWQDLADQLKPHYPYAHIVDSSGKFGLLLLSHVPFRKPTVSTAGLSQMPVVVTELQTPSGPLGLIIGHAPEAKDNAGLHDRDMYLSQLHAMALAMPIPSLLVGNLNAPPWSAGFSGLRTLNGVEPSSLSLPATWPAFLGPLGVPSDYIFLTTPLDQSRQIDLRGYKTIEPFEESSHQGVMATLLKAPL